MTEKYILAGEDTYHLAPFKYEWAYKTAMQSMANHWSPQEIQMGRDKSCYELDLSRDEKHLFESVFASLTTSDLAVQSNLAEIIYPKIKAAEIKLMLSRQIAEEALHSVSYQHVIEVLGLNQESIYTLYQRIGAINDWFQFAEFIYTDKPFIEKLIFNYCIWEGVFFPTAFAAIFSLQRRNLMTGTGEQLQYIFRDESLHIGFGIKLINEILRESQYTLDEVKIHNLFRDSLNYIDKWAEYCIPTILGYNRFYHLEHAKFLADKRLQQIGLPPIFNGQNVLPWLDEQVSLRKEKNFFETKVTEYQSGSSLNFDNLATINDIANWIPT